MTLRTKDVKKATQCNNTEVCYTYCDASNYKVHNRVVIEGNLTPADIEQILATRHDGEVFIPAQVGLPEERFSEHEEQDDHIWFILPDNAFSPTNYKPTTTITAAELLANFKSVAGNWDEIKAMSFLAGELSVGDENENWHEDDRSAAASASNESGGEFQICFSGLITALVTFAEDGKYAKCGNWSIAQGGYDLWWEIYYNGYTVLQCIDGELHGGFRPVPEFNENEEIELIKRVKDIYSLD